MPNNACLFLRAFMRIWTSAGGQHAGLPIWGKLKLDFFSSPDLSSISLQCWLISVIYVEANPAYLPWCQPPEQRADCWLRPAVSAAAQPFLSLLSIPITTFHTSNPLPHFNFWSQVRGPFQDSSSGTHLQCLQRRSMPTSCAQPVLRRLFSPNLLMRNQSSGLRDICPRVKAWRLLHTLHHFSPAFELSLPIYQEQSSQTARVP